MPLTCEHKKTGGIPYQCLDCKVPMCTDCGTTPKWWYSRLSYCRRCNEKNGYHEDVSVKIDVDIILTLCRGNEELATQFIELLRKLSW